jgi:hypothetical protein
LQQQYQKYQGQQAGYDRLLTLGRDAIQSRDQAIRQGQQNAAQAIRDAQQNSFQVGRDKAQQDAADREQRKRDFDAARDRIGMHAQEMLKSGEIPEHLIPKVRGLIHGKSIVMGSGYDETARQEFLKDYNAQLAGILSEIPPKPTPLTAQQLSDQNVVVRGGVSGQINKNGVWEPFKQEPKQPVSFGDYVQMEPEKARKAFADKLAAIKTSVANGKPLGPWKSAEDKAIAELEAPFQELHKRYGPPEMAPFIPGAPPIDQSQNSVRSILEQTPSQAIPGAVPASSQVGGSIETIPNYVPGSTPAPGTIPNYAPGSTPDVGTIPNYVPPDWKSTWDRADAALADNAAPSAPPPSSGQPLISNSQPSLDGGPRLTEEDINAADRMEANRVKRAGVASGGTVPPATPSAPMQALSNGEAGSTLPKVPTPNWSDMISSTRDQSDKVFYNNMRGVYQGKSPDIQNAIAIAVNPNSKPIDAARADEYLRSAGIDVVELAKPKAPGGGRRGKLK